MTIPDTFTAGDTLEFGVNVADYPPADGWTLKYRLIPRFTTPVQAAVELTATAGPVAVGDDTFDYAVTATPVTTATWAPGAYHWARWVEKTGARVTLRDEDSAGQLTILQNPATAAQGFEGRSAAQKALDDAVLARRDAAARAANVGATGTASGALVEYTIGERRFKYGTAQEALEGLIALEQQCRIDLAREKQALALQAGLASPRQVFVRAGRV